MGIQSWQETLIVAQSDGAVLTNSTAATSLLPAQAKYTLPANFCDQVGKRLNVRAVGRISTVVTTPGTLTFTVKFGATNVLVSQALALNVVAKTNVTWQLELYAYLRTAGTAAQFMWSGQWQSEAVVGSPAPSAGGAGALMIPASAPVVSTAFDATASQQIDLQATWSVASASNSIQLHEFALEALN